jgi:hypothetical protein
VRNAVADVLARVRIVSLFVAPDSLFFISFLMLLMLISNDILHKPFQGFSARF